MKTVCQVLRNFTVHILREMEIATDSNRPRAQLHHSITPKWNNESFSYDHCRQFALSFLFSFGHACTAILTI